VLTLEFYKVDWKDIEGICFALANRIEDDSYQPTYIVAILRGGMVPATILGDFLNIRRFYFIDIKFYRKIGETESVPRIVKSDLDEEIKDSNVLLVDDIADSGRTLKVALEHVYTFKPKSVRVLTLFKKSRSIITPDYFHEVIDKWVVFPWEIRETISEIRDRKILKKLNFDDCYLNKYLSY